MRKLGAMNIFGGYELVSLLNHVGLAEWRKSEKWSDENLD